MARCPKCGKFYTKKSRHLKRCAPKDVLRAMAREKATEKAKKMSESLERKGGKLDGAD